jgi:hypothetical protein
MQMIIMRCNILCLFMVHNRNTRKCKYYFKIVQTSQYERLIFFPITLVISSVVNITY